MSNFSIGVYRLTSFWSIRINEKLQRNIAAKMNDYTIGKKQLKSTYTDLIDDENH